MDKRLFFLLLFTAAAGLTTGVFFEVYMTGSGKTDLLDLLSAYLKTEEGLPFMQTAVQNIWRETLWFLLCVFMRFVPAALLPLLFAAAVLALSCKGFFLGFSAAMVLEAMGLPGIPHLTLCLFPSGMIQLLLFAALISYSIREVNKKRTASQYSVKQSLLTYLIGAAVLTFSVLLRAALLQAMT